MNTSNQNQKYLISEFFTFKASKDLILESEKNGTDLILVGILQKADTINRNGRIYPYNILKREAEKYMDLVNGSMAYGETDHPDSPIVSLLGTSHMVIDMWWEGNVLYGKCIIFDENPAGAILKGILKKGGVLGISSRGVGSVKNINGSDIVQDDFELIGFDFVSSPSTPGAYMFKEGFERPGMIPLLNTYDIEKVRSEGSISKYKEVLKCINDPFWKKVQNN